MKYNLSTQINSSFFKLFIHNPTTESITIILKVKGIVSLFFKEKKLLSILVKCLLEFFQI